MEWLNQSNWAPVISTLVVALQAGLLALIVAGIRYLFSKGKVDFTRGQWVLVEDAIDQGINYAEQKAFGLKKTEEKTMSSEDKMILAKDLSEKLLVQLNLTGIKSLAVPLIEARLRSIFFKEEK